MSNILEPSKKKWLSNLILLSFLVLVLATAFLSNAFKTPAKTQSEFIEQSLVFNNKELDKVTSLTLKNKLGEYQFSRASVAVDSAWHMTSPKNLSVSSTFIEKLFASLNSIKTKNLLIDDQANNSNFSLEKPTAILTLTDDAGKSLLISLGIMNAIDNSTYMKISGKSGIYHVEAPSISLENITIADLIKSTIFEFDVKKILSFKILKKKSQAVVFEVSKKEGIWTSTDGKKINTAKLEDLLNEFANLKSNFTLVELTDAQKNITNNLFSAGDYTVKITMDDNLEMLYNIGAATKNIPDLALSNEEYFVISEAKTPIIYVIKKEFMNLFEVKPETVKMLEEI